MKYALVNHIVDIFSYFGPKAYRRAKHLESSKSCHDGYFFTAMLAEKEKRRPCPRE